MFCTLNVVDVLLSLFLPVGLQMLETNTWMSDLIWFIWMFDGRLRSKVELWQNVKTRCCSSRDLEGWLCQMNPRVRQYHFQPHDGAVCHFAAAARSRRSTEHNISPGPRLCHLVVYWWNSTNTPSSWRPNPALPGDFSSNCGLYFESLKCFLSLFVLNIEDSLKLIWKLLSFIFETSACFIKMSINQKMFQPVEFYFVG